MKITIGTKIIAAALSAVILAVATAVLIQYRAVRAQGVELTRNTMRTMIEQAETVRDNMSALNRRDAFARAKLLEEVSQGGDLHETTFYKTIPVVAAWESLGAAARAQGFNFRIPSPQARNAKNTPTPEELQVLEALKADASGEYFRIDEARNELVFARSIVLSADCLGCHGDPKTSPTGDGLDVLGFPMENWKAGETRGAFVLRGTLDNVDRMVSNSMLATARWLAPITALIGLAFVLMNRWSIVRPLRHTIEEISAAAVQTAAAAGQVSAASQHIAEGASQQAASLEESSASLEEISSMTKRNAASAQDAKALAAQTRSVADAGAEDMQLMSHAMDEIKTSNQNIARIIKVIDEIAFQTNILALNAAVEAARAGEAGMGFAVVADEVRALAQRSAEAARETSTCIEETIRKGEQGAEISARIASSLRDIVSRSHQVDELIANIASASCEQSHGLELINTAVSQMDHVTQTNAAAAEECASTAKMLNSQAELVNHSVTELRSLVSRPAPAAPHPEPSALAATSDSSAFVHPPAPAPAPYTPRGRGAPLPSDRSFTEF